MYPSRGLALSSLGKERTNATLAHKLKVIGTVVGLLALAEGQSGAVTRLLRSLKRGITAAIATYLEDRGGIKLFTLEDEEELEVPSLAHLRTAMDAALLNTLNTADYITTATTTTPNDPSSLPKQRQPSNAPEECIEDDAQSSTTKLLTGAKIFACIGMNESKQLLALSAQVPLAPGELLFRAGQASDGVYIVSDGALGVYLEDGQGAGGGCGGANHQGVRINTLHFGESVGDIDLLDGAPRSVTCRAMEGGCTLVHIPRTAWLSFIHQHPDTLLSYLQRAISRLWRVGHFALVDFLQLDGHHIVTPFTHAPVAGKHLDAQDTATLAAAVTGQASIDLDLRNPTSGLEASPPSSPCFKSVLLPDQGRSGQTIPSPSNGKVFSVKPPSGRPSDQQQQQQQQQNEGASTFQRFMQPLQGILRTGKQGPGGNSSGMRRRSVSFSDDLKNVACQQQVQGGASVGNIASEGVPVMVQTRQACLAGGWDVVSPEESGLSVVTEVLLSVPNSTIGKRRLLSPGHILHDADQTMREFYILLEGSMLIERIVPSGKRTESALVVAGSVLTGAAFLSGTRSRAKLSAATPCILAAFGNTELDGLMALAAQKAHNPTQHNINTLAVSERPVSAQTGESEESPFAVAGKHISSIKESDSDTASLHTADEFSRSTSKDSLYMSALSSSGSSPPPESEDAFPLPDLPNHTATNGACLQQEVEDQGESGADENGEVVDYGVIVADLLLAASRALGPVIRRFISLGLSRRWLRSGELVYKQGDKAEALYIVISGRTRLVHCDRAGSVRIEEDIGRGESFGAVWALSAGRHDATCLCIRDAELVRMSRASFEVLSGTRPRAAARVLQGMAERLAACQTSRQGIEPEPPVLGVKRSSSSQYGPGSKSARPKGEIVTIAVLPAGTAPGQQQEVERTARALKLTLQTMFGPTILLDFAAVQLMFPAEADVLDIGFHRAKLTSWLSQKEEDCRFIILQGDAGVTPWSKICAGQADCTLLVAAPARTDPASSPVEKELVWDITERAAALVQETVTATSESPGQDSESSWDSLAYALNDPALFEPSAAAVMLGVEGTEVAAGGVRGMSPLRRVELVLIHEEGTMPLNTGAWLDARPLLTRHHHIRLTRSADLQRLGRWMAGTAVGVVLSGGGSRGLAHLGVLRALDDAGIPVDVVGGTSQGAFMAGVFAQGLGWTRVQASVKEYAQNMGSFTRLVRDLTLPLLSVFNGTGFNQVVKEAFEHGPQRIEDLWTRFFCVTTNLSLAAPQVHERGTLWRAVRASMTIVGLIPPVVDEHGHLHADGGYADNLPVGSMRRMGVGTVIVVDVEDRNQTAWLGLQPADGGVSGWQLLWDRWCPVTSWRFGIRMPGHAQLMNALTWMSHSQNLRRVAREHRIDLYLRPPVTQYRLLDYRLMDRIVREAGRYAFVTINDWQRRQQGLLGGQPLGGPGGAVAPGLGPLGLPVQGLPLRTGRGAGTRLGMRSRSIACMTQLQVKQSSPDAEDDDSRGSLIEVIEVPVLLERAATLPHFLRMRPQQSTITSENGVIGNGQSTSQADTAPVTKGPGDLQLHESCSNGTNLAAAVPESKGQTKSLEAASFKEWMEQDDKATDSSSSAAAGGTGDASAIVARQLLQDHE